MALGGPMLALAKVHVPPVLIALAVAYFLLGYLFYAGLMTAIGAVTNNMREAQQFAMMFTFANFLPFIAHDLDPRQPRRPLAVGLSLFPPTAPTTMMLRLALAVGRRPGLADRRLARRCSRSPAGWCCAARRACSASGCS